MSNDANRAGAMTEKQLDALEERCANPSESPPYYGGFFDGARAAANACAAGPWVKIEPGCPLDAL